MSRKKILVVDDEEDIRDLLKLSLNKLGLDTLVAGDVTEANKLVMSDAPIDFCLTDVRLPDGSGLEIVQQFKERRADTPIAVMTAFDSTDIAVEAMRAGAFDFLSKPIRHDKLKTMLENALSGSYPETLPPKDLLIGDSGAMLKLRSDIAKVARSLAPTLITGESGTGKELVARGIHQQSSRSSGPFIAVNCGAIPSELMESEFFGHVKGSFTGAVADKKGLFQAAEKGTLFLDEIADLPVHMQVKLLRVLQEKSVRPVGSDREIPTNVRIISATHKNLDDEVHNARFRQDLYYRINVIGLQIPALRERTDDLPALVDHILTGIGDISEHPVDISPQALDALKKYRFPGNVRELENILQRAAALCENQLISPGDLGLDSTLSTAGMAASAAPDLAGIQDLESHLADIEKALLQQALSESNGKLADTASRLNLSMRQLRYKLSKYDLNR